MHPLASSHSLATASTGAGTAASSSLSSSSDQSRLNPSAAKSATFKTTAADVLSFSNSTTSTTLPGSNIVPTESITSQAITVSLTKLSQPNLTSSLIREKASGVSKSREEPAPLKVPSKAAIGVPSEVAVEEPVQIPATVVTSIIKQSSDSASLSLSSADLRDSFNSSNASSHQIKFAEYGLSGPREKYVLAVTEANKKFAKVQVCSPHMYGQVMVEAQVKEWDHKL